MSKSKSESQEAMQITVRTNHALNDVQNEIKNAIILNPSKILKLDRNSSFTGDFLQNISRIPEPDQRQKSQNLYVSFQKCFKWLIICGQICGLNPISGITFEDAAKVRFYKLSLRSLVSYFFCAFQGTATVYCLYRLFNSTVSISTLSFVSFYGATAVNTVLFLNIAYKWPNFVQVLAQTPLNEYINPKLQLKCNVTVFVFLSFSILEHILSAIARMTEISSCNRDQEVFRKYVYKICPWMKELNLPYNTVYGVLLEILVFISSMNWNYSDLFIICISFYLISVLEGINKKISMTRGKYVPSAIWRSLREDYNRATQLVRYVDDVINGVTLTSFACNLFFICTQIFNFLTNGIKHPELGTGCTKITDGPFAGYEQTIYFGYSLTWLLVRSSAVALIAAGVHSQSLVPAVTLYDVPTSGYCSEVQRFLEQLHADNVALTGLRFFNVTKGLILSIASTIVTYELVLIQFNGNQNTLNT